ncbi:DUF4328 domain-containing protein [Sphingomonas sp.]
MCWLVASAIYCGGAVFSIVGITAYQNGSSSPLADLETVDLVSIVTSGIYFVAELVCVVVIGRWIYRVNKNAWQISDAMTVSPGWSVGFFFIPILNLFRPFTGLRETWQASHAPADAQDVPVPAIMRLWWAGWLILGVFGQLSFRLSLRAETLEDLLEVAWVDIVATPFDFITGLALLWIVRRLTETQSHLRDHSVFE